MGGSPSPFVIYCLLTRTTYYCLPQRQPFALFAVPVMPPCTRLAPEQARLAPTAPRCVATGAWDKWLADHDVAVLAAWCHLLLVPTSVRKVSLVQYWARCRRWRSCYRRLMHRAHALADSHNPAPCVGPTAPAWCRTRLRCVCVRTRSQPIGTAVALLLTSSPTHEVRLRSATLTLQWQGPSWHV